MARKKRKIDLHTRVLSELVAIVIPKSLAMALTALGECAEIPPVPELVTKRLEKIRNDRRLRYHLCERVSLPELATVMDAIAAYDAYLDELPEGGEEYRTAVDTLLKSHSLLSVIREGLTRMD